MLTKCAIKRTPKTACYTIDIMLTSMYRIFTQVIFIVAKNELLITFANRNK